MVEAVPDGEARDAVQENGRCVYEGELLVLSRAFGRRLRRGWETLKKEELRK